MLAIFSVLSDIDVSYKTIERLYSDEEVDMALHNLHILILKKKGVKNIDAAGDGTGYSLTISKHYATETQKRGRLDRYYSCAYYLDGFSRDTKIYVIPKKKTRMRGNWNWKRTLIDFVKNIEDYLE